MKLNLEVSIDNEDGTHSVCITQAEHVRLVQDATKFIARRHHELRYGKPVSFKSVTIVLANILVLMAGYFAFKLPISDASLNSMIMLAFFTTLCLVFIEE